jgi:cyclophilin family peptidyl-prolyl cis-trans isomerase
MAPAPHLNTAYVVFGEIVKGMPWAERINKLATPSGTPNGQAKVVDAGQLGWMEG